MKTLQPRLDNWPGTNVLRVPGKILSVRCEDGQMIVRNTKGEEFSCGDLTMVMLHPEDGFVKSYFK
jgi:hypothetical protein